MIRKWYFYNLIRALSLIRNYIFVAHIFNIIYF